MMTILLWKFVKKRQALSSLVSTSISKCKKCFIDVEFWFKHINSQVSPLKVQQCPVKLRIFSIQKNEYLHHISTCINSFCKELNNHSGFWLFDKMIFRTYITNSCYIHPVHFEKQNILPSNLAIYNLGDVFENLLTFLYEIQTPFVFNGNTFYSFTFLIRSFNFQNLFQNSRFKLAFWTIVSQLLWSKMYNFHLLKLIL